MRVKKPRSLIHDLVRCSAETISSRICLDRAEEYCQYFEREGVVEAAESVRQNACQRLNHAPSSVRGKSNYLVNRSLGDARPTTSTERLDILLRV